MDQSNSIQRKKRVRVSAVDKEKAHTLYVSGFKNAPEIARELGISVPGVYNWITGLKWKEERARLAKELNERSMAELVAIQAKERSEVVRRHLEVGKTFELQVGRTVETSARSKVPLSARDLSDIGKALQAGTTVTARAVGLDQVQNNAPGVKFSLLINTSTAPVQDAMPEPGRDRFIDVSPESDSGDEF